MLQKFLDKLVSRKRTMSFSRKPLSLGTIYKYTVPVAPPAPVFKFDDIVTLAKQHPDFRDATLQIRTFEPQTLFVGFDKPVKIATHVIVYPEQVYRSSQWYDLARHAEKRNVKIGIFQLREKKRCIEIIHHDQTIYLIDPSQLKLRHWSIVPAPNS